MRRIAQETNQSVVSEGATLCVHTFDLQAINKMFGNET